MWADGLGAGLDRLGFQPGFASSQPFLSFSLLICAEGFVDDPHVPSA